MNPPQTSPSAAKPSTSAKAMVDKPEGRPTAKQGPFPQWLAYTDREIRDDRGRIIGRFYTLGGDWRMADELNLEVVHRYNNYESLLSAAQGVLSWYAVWQRDPDKSPNTAKVFFDALTAATSPSSVSSPIGSAAGEGSAKEGQRKV